MSFSYIFMYIYIYLFLCMYTQAYIQFKMCRERPDNRKKRKGPRPQPAVPSPAAMPNRAASLPSPAAIDFYAHMYKCITDSQGYIEEQKSRRVEEMTADSLDFLLSANILPM